MILSFYATSYKNIRTNYIDIYRNGHTNFGPRRDLSKYGALNVFIMDIALMNIGEQPANYSEKEIDRITHVDVCNAQTGPIFLAYRAKKAIDEIVDKVKQTEAVYSFVSDDGIGHSVWIISDDNDIETIRNEFEKLSDIYIADGHHRAASAVKVGIKRRNENPDADYRESDYFLSVLFPHDQLKILPYNRVVKDLNGFTYSGFLDKLSDKFEIKEEASGVYPIFKGDFGMFLNRKWYTAVFKGRYTPARIMQTAVNFLLLLCFILTMISGIMISKHLFVFMKINIAGDLMRKMHLCAANWAFVLMSFHAGTHGGAMTAKIKHKKAFLQS